MNLDEQQVWINISITAGLGPAAAQKIARYLQTHRMGAGELMKLDREALQSEVGLKPSVADLLASQLENPVSTPQPPDGVKLLTPGEEHFPNHRMLSANPPLPTVLYGAGDTSRLAWMGPALAVAGSRDTSEDVLSVVHSLASEASRRGWLVVSGLARGVDSAAHQGALRGGTGTVGVLACGIANAGGAWFPDDLDGVCIVSQFDPEEPWSGPRAMQRNPTIAALADRVLVAAAGSSGGSWEMAQSCLKREKPLFVFDLEPAIAPGNRALIAAGAIAVDPGDPSLALSELEEPPTLF